MMLIYLFFLHFIGDFLFQSRNMGKKKSESLPWLARHLLYYGLTLLVGLTIIGADFVTSLKFVILNLVFHGVQDWFIWKGYKLFVQIKIWAYRLDVPESYAYWEDRWFYTTIGLDQTLHLSIMTLLFMVFTG